MIFFGGGSFVLGATFSSLQISQKNTFSLSRKNSLSLVLSFYNFNFVSLSLYLSLFLSLTDADNLLKVRSVNGRISSIEWTIKTAMGSQRYLRSYCNFAQKGFNWKGLKIVNQKWWLVRLWQSRFLKAHYHHNGFYCVRQYPFTLTPA